MYRKKIPTFVVNLPDRTDRYNHIVKEFEGRDEFELTIIRAVEHKIGAIGLWQSFRNLVKQAQKNNLDYILICEDDHQFTAKYNPRDFVEKVSLGKEKGFDLLLGGVSSFNGALHYKENLFWVEQFTGMQFVVIFKKFYETFLSISLRKHDNLDVQMYLYTDNIFVFYPQISIQKNFNYSDITHKNNQLNVEEYYESTEKKFSFLQSVESYYRALS